MSRAKWKGFHVDKCLLKKKLPKKIYSRSSVILSKYVGKRFLVYNGKSFIPVHISSEKIGHKFGEFSYTKKKVVKKISKKKLKK